MKDIIKQFIDRTGQFFTKYPYLLWFFFFAFIYAGVSLAWFRDKSFIYYWDQTFFFNPAKDLDVYRYLWHNTTGFGGPDNTGVNFLPIQFTYKILSQLLSLSVIQRLVISVEIFVTFASFYLAAKYFLKDEVKDNKVRNLISLFGSLFYLVNPFAIIYIWRLNLNSVFIYAFFPFIFLQFHKVLTERKIAFNFILLQLSFFFVIQSFSHPAYLIATWGFFFLYLFFLLIKSFWQKEKQGMSIFIRFLVVFITWILLNFWWLFSQLAGASNSIQLSGNEYGIARGIFITTTSKAHLLNLIRLLGEWHFYDYHFGANDFSFLELFASKKHLANWLFFIPPAIIAIGVYLKRSWRKSFLAVVLVLLMLFISGSRSPLWSLIDRAYAKITPLWAFRNPYEKSGFLFVFIYSLLLVLAMGSISRYKNYKLVTILALISIIAPISVFVTGRVVPNGNERLPEGRISVDPAYQEVADYLTGHATDGVRTLILPYQDSPLQYSKDGVYSYIGQDLITNLTQLPTIATNTGNNANDKINSLIEDQVKAGNFEVLNRYGIKYVLFDDNLVSTLTYGRKYSTQEIENKALSEGALKQAITKGNIRLYENAHYQPLLTTTNSTNTFFASLADSSQILPQMKENQNLLSCASTDNTTCFQTSNYKAALSINGFDNFYSNQEEAGLLKTFSLPTDQYSIDVLGFNSNKLLLNNNQISGAALVPTGTNLLELSGSSQNIEELYNLKSTNKLDFITLSALQNHKEESKITQKTQDRIEFEQYADGSKVASLLKVKNEPGKAYTISFNYRNQNRDDKFGEYYQSPTTLAFFEGKDSYSERTSMQESLSETPLPFANSWTEYSHTYWPKTNSEYLYVYIINNGLGNGSYFAATDLKINQINLPRIIFSNQLASQSEGAPNISTIVKSPTLVEGTIARVDAPFYLNFSESFNSGWQLKINGKVVSEADHYILNGVGNSWLVTQKGDLKLELSYLPQSQFNKSIFISVVSATVFVVASLAWLTISYIRRRKNAVE